MFHDTNAMIVWEGTVSLRWKVTVLSVGLSVSRSVGRSVVISNAVSKKERKECILVGS